MQFRGGKGTETLPFSIRCDRFTVEFYEDGAPKVFRSDLTFLQEGKAVRQGALLVNHPIAFGGLRFYQSSYGTLPGGRMAISYTRGDGKAEERETAVGDRFALPGGAGEVKVIRGEDNLMRMGPAVKLSVTSPRGEVQFWVFQHIERIKEANPGVLAQVPIMNPGLFAPWMFSLEKKGEKFYTVLQAARDPGVPLVAGGAVLLVAGLMMTFFFSHRRFRIVLEEKKGKSRIGLAGSSNRDPVGLEKEMNQLLAEIGKAEGHS
jgi:cytochrome c biogenesis protein